MSITPHATRRLSAVAVSTRRLLGALRRPARCRVRAPTSQLPKPVSAGRRYEKDPRSLIKAEDLADRFVVRCH